MKDSLIDRLEYCKSDIADNDINAGMKRFVWDCAIEEVRQHEAAPELPVYDGLIEALEKIRLEVSCLLHLDTMNDAIEIVRQHEADALINSCEDVQQLADKVSHSEISDNHCKDCCCAKCWQALGITEYTGKSIPEHIAELRATRGPVSVSLEKCAIAASRWQDSIDHGKPQWKTLRDDTREEYRNQVRAILSAAGVKYDR